MKLINKLNDIDWSLSESIVFKASVLDITDIGDESKKRPMKFSMILEENGEVFNNISWAFKYKDLLLKNKSQTEVLEVEALAGVFRDEQQIRVGSIKETGVHSKHKISIKQDSTELKNELNSMIKLYVTTPMIKTIVNELVLNNSKFFKWPAGTSVHHAFPEGLLQHSINTAKIGVNIAKTYSTNLIDLELVFTGCLLHDIGKTVEYNEDGSRSIISNLMTHLTIGAEMIDRICLKNGLDANKDKKILMLKHIILSHHGEPEFGSTIRPAILEALIVHKADSTDAAVNGAIERLINTEVGSTTDRLLSTSNKMLRWR